MGQSDLSYNLPFGRYRARNFILSEKISGMSNVQAFCRLTMEDRAKSHWTFFVVHFIPDHGFFVRSELARTARPLSWKMPAGMKNARFFGNFLEGFKSKKVRFSDFSSGSYCERYLRAKFQFTYALISTAEDVFDKEANNKSHIQHICVSAAVTDTSLSVHKVFNRAGYRSGHTDLNTRHPITITRLPTTAEHDNRQQHNPKSNNNKIAE
ncbi:hypothetical protein J6590_007485 [Homalodisca vitripennis]|nr:hypothetical protein J6590_007485 [Homalodisca vitripennis]